MTTSTNQVIAAPARVAIRLLKVMLAAPEELDEKLTTLKEWSKKLARELEREKRARRKLNEYRALVGFE